MPELQCPSAGYKRKQSRKHPHRGDKRNESSLLVGEGESGHYHQVPVPGPSTVVEISLRERGKDGPKKL